MLITGTTHNSSYSVPWRAETWESLA